MTKFVVFKSPINEQWYFHLVSQNGRVIAQSEGYKRQGSAMKAVAAVKKCSAASAVIVRTDSKTRHR